MRRQLLGRLVGATRLEPAAFAAWEAVDVRVICLATEVAFTNLANHGAVSNSRQSAKVSLVTLINDVE
jgi:hypothetical protein